MIRLSSSRSTWRSPEARCCCLSFPVLGYDVPSRLVSEASKSRMMDQEYSILGKKCNFYLPLNHPHIFVPFLKVGEWSFGFVHENKVSAGALTGHFQLCTRFALLTLDIQRLGAFGCSQHSKTKLNLRLGNTTISILMFSPVDLELRK